MKIMLRIPTVDTIEMALAQWLNWLGSEPRDVEIDVGIRYMAGWGAAEARNNIVREFLEGDHTHLWMIDPDVVPPTHLDILAYGIHPVVCGPYEGWKSEQGGIYWHVYHTPVWKDEVGQDFYTFYERQKWPNELFRAHAAGTGCILIQRETLEQLPEDPFHFFRNKQGELMGEDFEFFKAVKGTYVDPNYCCEHIKKVGLTKLHDAFLRRLMR